MAAEPRDGGHADDKPVGRGDELLTRPEGAAILRVTPRTLSAYRIPKVRCGKFVRYRRADIERFIADHLEADEATPPSPATTPAALRPVKPPRRSPRRSFE